MSTKNVILAILGAALLIVAVIAGAAAIEHRQDQVVASSTETTVTPASHEVLQPGSTGTTTPVPPESATVEARIGVPASALNIKVTPLAVLEDSRCPVDVQCIQAGTVQVRVRVESGLGTSEQVIALGGSMTTEAETVTFVSVTPDKRSGTGIAPDDYRFTFRVSRP